jgi:hypothetical protein
MPNAIRALTRRAVTVTSVRIDGRYTVPRSYGVYVLPNTSGSSRRYRFGNHPIRLIELNRDFPGARLRYLFLSREESMELANILNALE